MVDKLTGFLTNRYLVSIVTGLFVIGIIKMFAGKRA